jgi:hypothetical protein
MIDPTKDQYPSPAEIRAMAEKTVRYLFSPEGQMQLRKHREEADKIVELFRQARNIPWEKLHEPFTI